MIDNVIHAAIVMTTPVLLAALGGLINRLGGLVNIGLDSMMLAGALVGLMLASQTGVDRCARGCALVGGGLGLLMSLTVTRLGADEIIVGLGFNILVAGLVRFFLKSAYNSSARSRCRTSHGSRASTFPCPGRPDPRCDPVRTRPAHLGGMDPRARHRLVPEEHEGRAQAPCGRRGAAGRPRARALPARHPRCVHGLRRRDGRPRRCLPVDRRRRALQRRHHGRPWLHRSRRLLFRRNRPWLTAACALLFGFFDAFQIRLQGRGVPAELVQTLPYAMVIVVLA